jgi:Phosphotransferase enzyme family.
MDTLNMLKNVSERYDISGVVSDYMHCSNGHINDTYRVICSIGEENIKEYIFQRINTYVFTEPVKVMHNIKEITSYLKPRFSKDDCKIRTYLDNKNGENYTCFDDSFWRVCHFVDNSVTYETIEDSKVLYSAGYAFGRFQHLLSDFPMDRLYHTIPDFHNTKKRMKDFFNVVKHDPLGRSGSVDKEIAFFEKHCDIASGLVDLLEKGELPLRVTHNDTKYNNILMHKDTCEPLCVIDLDTVMPGLSMYDFGDAIRFAANTSVEDETDLSKVGLNMDNYIEFTRGFIGASKDFLTKKEIENMALGAIVITIELASRFLADHIKGDKYFRIHKENHNLDRARCQIKLAEDMMAKYDEMCDIVNMYCN